MTRWGKPGLEVTPIERPRLHMGDVDRMAVEIMREWIALGYCEVGGNNKGGFVRYVTNGFENSWCAGAQWTAMDEACKRLGRRNPIPWRRKVNRARGLLELYVEAGRPVPIEEVRVGDYLCLPRGIPGVQGHAQRISEGSYPHVSVIDGNVGSFRRTQGRVREIESDLSRIKVVGAARLG